MATTQGTSTNDFNKWVKGALAVSIAKDGLTDFICSELCNFQGYILQTALKASNSSDETKCSLCKVVDLIPCRTNGYCQGKPCCYHKSESKVPKLCKNQLCNFLKDEITRQHEFKSPSWKNTDAQKWCSDAFEIAKCYMPPEGYSDKTSVADTDFNGIVSVIINNKHFVQQISKDLSHKAREVGKRIRHSASSSLKDGKLEEVFTALIDLLSIPSCLAKDCKAKQAVQRLNEIRNKLLTINIDNPGATFQDEYLSKLTTDVVEECLQRHLIEFYRRTENHIPITPFAEENEVPLKHLYVPPSLAAVELSQVGKWHEKPAQQEIDNFKELFFSGDSKAFKKIYVTAKPGAGKTSFAKYVCQAWSDSKNRPSNDSLPQVDIDALNFYDFLFLISLREIDKEICDVDTMVRNFVKTNFPQEYYGHDKVIDKILVARTCLVILDGLDEWGHSETCEKGHRNSYIPRVKQWDKCTILTTTRPWKFDEGRLKSHEIDRHIVIKDLDSTSSRLLVLKAMKLLKRDNCENELDNYVEQFYSATSSLHLEDLRTIPYIHLQMVCLWNENNEVGYSMCQLYTNITAHTLTRRPPPELCSTELQQTLFQLPPCVRKSECCKYPSLMFTAGKLAFHTLFESKIVFDKYFALTTVGIREEYLLCMLRTGLLTQSRNTSIAERRSDLSFQHKTMQEFFAALFIQSDFDSVKGRIVSVCSSLESVLNMSYVFIFLCGLSPQEYIAIHNELTRGVILKDTTVKEYRSRLLFTGFHGAAIYRLMWKFQMLVVECIKEGARNGNHDIVLPIEDIIIDSSSKKYESILEQLIRRNPLKVKSLSMREFGNSDDFSRSCRYLKLLTTESLETLDLMIFEREDIEKLLCNNKMTLRCVNLRSMVYKGNEYIEDTKEFPMTCLKSLKEIQFLQALSLDCFSMKHDQLHELMEFLSGLKTMKEIGLKRIYCSEHADMCNGFTLNLQGHETLCGLYLHIVPLSKLILETENMCKCQVGRLSESVANDWLRKLPNAHKLETLSCLNFSCNQATLTNVIPKLTHLKSLVFYRTELGEKRIPLSSNMRCLEWIVLERVKMTSSALEELFNFTKNIENHVIVKLRNCSVTPEEGLKSVKKKITELSNVQVIFDGCDDKSHSIFTFQTVKR